MARAIDVVQVKAEIAAEKLAVIIENGSVLLKDMQSGEAVKIATLTTPNEPLTLEELRKMDGEPVWVELYQAWALVEIKQNGVVMFYGNDFSCSYSRTWQVYRFQPYRRPPEGEA